MEGRFDLLELMEQYGIKGLIVFVAVSLIASLFRPEVLNKGIDKISDFFKSGKKDQLVTESNILNHDLFNFIDFWIESTIPTMEFATKFREAVFRKYLIIFMEEYKSGMLSFIKEEKYKSMDEAELWKEFIDIVNKIVANYEKRSIEVGIPPVVVFKMKIKNNDTIKLMMDLVNNISRSDFYESDDNYLKLYSIMNIMLSILENTITNSVVVCDSINGEMRGLKFGDEIEP